MATTTLDLEAEVTRLVEYVRGEGDHMARATYAGDLQKLFRTATTDLAKLRRVAMREAWASGWTLEDIAEAFDITRTRVEQIIKS